MTNKNTKPGPSRSVCPLSSHRLCLKNLCALWHDPTKSCLIAISLQTGAETSHTLVKLQEKATDITWALERIYDALAAIAQARTIEAREAQLKITVPTYESTSLQDRAQSLAYAVAGNRAKQHIQHLAELAADAAVSAGIPIPPDVHVHLHPGSPHIQRIEAAAEAAAAEASLEPDAKAAAEAAAAKE